MTKRTQALAPKAVLAAEAFGKGEGTITAIAMGHINATFELTHPSGAYILQWVNPMFAPEVNLDIVDIVRELQNRGVTAPQLQETVHGHYWFVDDAGGTWRLMTKIMGHTVERCTNPGQCRAVGTMLGRFHSALAGLDHTFRAPRLGVHDTARHLKKLEQALVTHQGHLAYRHIAPLAKTLLRAGQQLPIQALSQGPERIVHGDPKISNFIFDGAGQAIALVDLDTLATMPLALELGDALRSWCSPGGEDPQLAGFELDHFRAAIEGYREGVGELLQPNEVAGLSAALGTIATELAARFACDALEERYFGWDDSRYSAAWEHNLRRAKSQWILAQSFAQQQHTAARIVERVFGLTDPQSGDRATAG